MFIKARTDSTVKSFAQKENCYHVNRYFVFVLYCRLCDILRLISAGVQAQHFVAAGPVVMPTLVGHESVVLKFVLLQDNG